MAKYVFKPRGALQFIAKIAKYLKIRQNLGEKSQSSFGKSALVFYIRAYLEAD